jgi:hypothetical protein
MSNNYLHLIPTDPAFVPDSHDQSAALAALKAALPNADQIFDEVTDRIAFRDCGANFECVRCPNCETLIPLDIWQSWMDADCDQASGFRLAYLVMPCCKFRATLNELIYDFSQGFSCYALSTLNACTEITSDTLAVLEKTLGCRRRIIRQHI